MQFKLWLEEKEIFQHQKNALRDLILSILDPNEDYTHVLASRLDDYKDPHGILRGPHFITHLFDKNHQIWSAMDKAFPGEVGKANQVKDWLKQARPNTTIADLFRQIGLTGQPIVVNKQPKMTPKGDATNINQGPTIPNIKQAAPAPMPPQVGSPNVPMTT